VSPIIEKRPCIHKTWTPFATFNILVCLPIFLTSLRQCRKKYIFLHHDVRGRHNILIRFIIEIANRLAKSCSESILISSSSNRLFRPTSLGGTALDAQKFLIKYGQGCI